MHEVLIRSSRLEPSSRTTIALTITKLSRYSSISRFLLQAARKYPVFNRVQISAVYFGAPNLPSIELDSKTADLIYNLFDGPQLRKLTSKFYGLSSCAIKDHIRQEATLAIPVHAEVQLLFYYERNFCNLPPRIVCSSKQACFLCDLFFKIHGRFTIPSAHGRLYEKWALPDAVKSIANANGDILTTLKRFASAIENALIRETQSTRTSYPNPHESIILQSAVCSQSNQSATSARSSLASQRHIQFEDSISASQNNIMLPISSPIPYAGETATESRIDALRSRSEASSAATIRAPSPSDALPEYVISPEENTSSHNLHISLEKGQPVWRKLSSPSHSMQVRTPRINLTISQDEIFSDLLSREPSHDLVAGGDHYWVILEYISERSVLQGKNVLSVNLLDVPKEREMTLDYGSADWPRELQVYNDDDVISIKCSPRKPVEELEHRM